MQWSSAYLRLKYCHACISGAFHRKGVGVTTYLEISGGGKGFTNYMYLVVVGGGGGEVGKLLQWW